MRAGRTAEQARKAGKFRELKGTKSHMLKDKCQCMEEIPAYVPCTQICTKHMHVQFLAHILPEASSQKNRVWWLHGGYLSKMQGIRAHVVYRLVASGHPLGMQGIHFL